MNNFTVTIKPLDNSQVEITGEITAEFFESMRKSCIETLSKNAKIDGFRPGHIPENILVEKLGEMTILEEMAERAIGELYPTIITENKIDAIGRPVVSITKIAAKNPLGFMIKQAVMPEINLPDYIKIAEKINKDKVVIPKVTDAEVEAVIADIIKSRTENNVAPELNDEFVKSLGNFTDVADLKMKLATNIKMEKEYREKDKRRGELIDAVIAETKLELPDVIVERELDSIISEMKSQVTQMGMKFEEYLERLKKTEEVIRTESREPAIKRAKTGLLLHAISNKEQIVPDKEKMDAEVDRIMGMYQDADIKAVQHYVEGILKNEAVFKLLEEASKN